MRELLLSISVNCWNSDEVLRSVAQRISSNRGFSLSIAQANVYSIVTAAQDSTYRNSMANADLCVPDGMPLVWLLWSMGHRNVERVYGPDLMLRICERAAKERWRCFFYGAEPGVPELLKEKLVSRYPGLNVVGTYSPPFRALTDEEDAQVCTMINEARPDILWVGLGSPKQDIWMYEHRYKLNVPVMHGVGAAFDFLSGRVRQAPRWMMNAGLEWLFRLIQEPRRLWKRYTIVNVKFVYYLLTWWLRKRR